MSSGTVGGYSLKLIWKLVQHATLFAVKWERKTISFLQNYLILILMGGCLHQLGIGLEIISDVVIHRHVKADRLR